MMKFIQPILVFLVLLLATPSPASETFGNQAETQVGPSSDALPFVMHLSSRPPSSLHEFVDSLYESLPEERLHLIAAYYGGRDYERLRVQYPNLNAFYEDLRITSILARAAVTWRFQGTRYSLYPRIACVGRDFSTQVAIQIALRYMRSTPGQFDASESERGRGFRQASYVSQRLFEVCDQGTGDLGRASRATPTTPPDAAPR